jgi:hypothetical protein
MSQLDFYTIVKDAWKAYDSSRNITSITDISAMVSTNHVYRIKFVDKSFIIAKLSYFGQFDHFVEDHSIINSLSNNLPAPFENFLARSLMKGNKLFVHHFQNDLINVWVVFYRPISVKKRLPRRLDLTDIGKLGVQFAQFHLACTKVKNTLPESSKTMKSDIIDLLEELDTDHGYYEFGVAREMIEQHCYEFLESYQKLSLIGIDAIPVFVDWNIGNFSVTKSYKLYSRWDYDWFRMSTRMIDFYFFSRVVSDKGDRTVFTYDIDVMQEERFIHFLKSYHAVFPLKAYEIDFLPQIYRFFLLHYVIKFGRYFFHEVYATKMRTEAFNIHLPSIQHFDTLPLKKALNL